MSRRNNFGLWLYDYNLDDTTIRKLSRVFTIACDHYKVNKLEFDTPEKFRKHLEEHGADNVVIKAFEKATDVWKLNYHNYLKHLYSLENFENYP